MGKGKGREVGEALTLQTGGSAHNDADHSDWSDDHDNDAATSRVLPRPHLGKRQRYLTSDLSSTGLMSACEMQSFDCVVELLRRVDATVKTGTVITAQMIRATMQDRAEDITTRYTTTRARRVSWRI